MFENVATSNLVKVITDLRLENTWANPVVWHQNHALSMVVTLKNFLIGAFYSSFHIRDAQTVNSIQIFQNI